MRIVLIDCPLRILLRSRLLDDEKTMNLNIVAESRIAMLFFKNNLDACPFSLDYLEASIDNLSFLEDIFYVGMVVRWRAH
jgi:hypothetical protein